MPLKQRLPRLGGTDLDVEVINFFVEHFGEMACSEGDVRAPTAHCSYGPFAVSAKIDRQKATIFFRRHEVDRTFGCPQRLGLGVKQAPHKLRRSLDSASGKIPLRTREEHLQMRDGTA